MFKKILAVLALAVPLLCSAQSAQGNLSAIVLPSAARVATVSTSDKTNTSWLGGHFIVNVSAYTSGNWTPKIQGKDPVSGNYYDICVGAAISSVSTVVIRVYPGLTNSPNLICNDVLPKTWRFQMVGAATPISTFSVGAFLN